jgi:hypothetical protein
VAARGIKRVALGALDAGGLEIDQRELQTAFARLVGTARQDDAIVRDRSVDDGDFLSIQLSTLERGADVLGQDRTGSFCARKSPDDFAGRDLGQQTLLLIFAAGDQESFGEKIDGRRKRNRRKRTAHLLRNHAEFEIAETESAVIFRNRCAGPAHFADLLPKYGIEMVLALKDLAHRFRRAFLGQELVRLVLEHFLIV